MAGEEHELGGEVAVRQRDARVGRDRDAGRHAGHDLVADARLAERLGLLAAAAEDERIAALQPHHAPAGPRLFHQQAR